MNANDIHWRRQTCKWTPTFDFEAGDAVVVDIVAFKIAETIIERKDANVSAVMNMIPSHDGVGVILHPDARESVAADLVIFVQTLSVISDIKPDVLAVGNIASADHGLSA